MYELKQEFIYKVLGEIMGRIEACGASPELTHAVTLTSDLRSALGNQENPANPYSLLRVIDATAAVRRPNPDHGAPKPAGHNPVA